MSQLTSIDKALKILGHLPQQHLSMPPDEFLRFIADQARELLSAEVCILWTLDENDRFLKVRETSGKGVDKEYKSLKLDPSDNRMKHLSEGKPGFVRDVRKPNPRFQHAAMADSRGWISLLTAPLRAGGHLIGMLDLFTTTEREFQPWETDAFCAFANSAALCLWTRAVQAEQVIELYDALNSAATSDELLQQILERNIRMLRADAGHIRLLDNRTNELVLKAGVGPYQYFARIRKPVGSDTGGNPAAARKPKHVSDVRAQPHFRILEHSFSGRLAKSAAYEEFLGSVRSEHTLPLKGDSGTCALITFYATTESDRLEVSADDCADLFVRSLKQLRSFKKLDAPGVTRALMGAVSLEERSLQQLQRALDVFQGYSAHIRLRDRNHRELVYLSGIGPIDYISSHLRVKDLGTDTFSRVLRSGQSFRTNLFHDPHFDRLNLRYEKAVAEGTVARNFEFEEYIRTAQSEMVVPLIAQRKIIGCAALTSRTADAFDDTACKDLYFLMQPVSDAIAAAAADAGISVSDFITIVSRSRNELRKVLAEFIERQTPSLAYGHIWGVDQRGRSLCLLTSAGPQGDFLPARAGFDSFARYRNVLQGGLSYVSTNLREEPHFRQMREKHDIERRQEDEYQKYLAAIQSEVIVPFSAEGRLLGTATLQSNQPDYFSYADQRVLDNSMRYAAVRIEQLELSQKINAMQDELKSVQSPQRLHPVLRHLARSAVELTRADVVGIYEYHSDRQSFELPGIIEGTLIRPVHTEREIRSKSIPATIIKNRRAVIASNSAEIEEYFCPPSASSKSHQSGFAQRERIKAAAGLVLEVPGEILGVMFFNFRNEQSFSENRIQLMKMFASEASIAIRNARIHTRAQLQDLQLKLMDRFALQQELRQVAMSAAAAFKADSAHITLRVEKNGQRPAVRLVAEEGNTLFDSRKEVPADDPLLGNLFASLSPVIVPDVAASAYKQAAKALRRGTVESFAICPLKNKGTLLGSLVLLSETRDTFFEELRPQLHDYCDLAVEAIRKQEKYEDAVKHVDKLERLNELVPLLENRRSLKEKIALILTAITMGGGLGFNRALLFLTDRDEKAVTLSYSISPSSDNHAHSLYKEWATSPKAPTTLDDLTRGARVEESVYEGAEFLGLNSPLTVLLSDKSQVLAKSVIERTPAIFSKADLDRVDALHAIADKRFALVPLWASGVLGILYVDNHFTSNRISVSDLALLRLYGERAALTLKDARDRESTSQEN